MASRPHMTYGSMVSRPGRPMPDNALMKAIQREETSLLERISPYFCEFLGTFMLALTLGYCATFGDLLFLPTAVAAVYMVLIYSVGPVSGGNLNPAVSLALGFIGKLKWPVVFGYMIAQLCGGLLAAFLVKTYFDTVVQVRPQGDYGIIPAGLAEIFYTWMLCFVFLNCAASKRNNPKYDGNQFYALAIGLVIVAGSYAVYDISGAIFNPALSLGFGIMQSGSGILYTAFQMIGAAMAAMAFKAVRPEDYHLDDEVALLNYQVTIESKGLAEFLGTFVLVMTVCLATITLSVGTAWSAAAALISMIYSLGDISGAHFNPAVSFAVMLAGRAKCGPRTCALYVLMQVLAAIVAGYIVSYVQFEGPKSTEIFGLAPQPGATWSQVSLVEIVFTFFLAWTVLSVATTSTTYPGNAPPPKRNFYFALAIGVTVAIAGFAIGSISGGVLNPAVAVGLQVEMLAQYGASDNTTQDIVTVMDNLKGVSTVITAEHFVPDTENCLWYSLLELGGAFLAAVIFHSSHAHEFYAKNALP